MRKIIIYGIGQVYLRLRNELAKNNIIIAVSDSSISEISYDEGFLTIAPGLISEYSFDYIAICSSRYFNQIEETLLGEYGLPKDKIISAFWLIEHEPLPELNAVNSILTQYNMQTVLDFGMSALPLYFYQKAGILQTVSIDGFGKEKYPYYWNIYNNIFDDCAMLHRYDALLYYVSPFGNNNFMSELKCIGKLMQEGIANNVIIVSSGHIDSETANQISKWGSIRKYKMWESCIYFISKVEESRHISDVQIYVMCHKPYFPYSDEIYSPLFLGEMKTDSYLSEHIGYNIAQLNIKLNECTGLYWIWKNSHYDIVGLAHYRRYFYNDDFECSENRLNYNTIKRYLRNFDIILSPIHNSHSKQQQELIKNSVDSDAYEKSRNIIRKHIKEKQASYIELFDYVMTGKISFLTNLFVTRKNIIDKYCEWLFSFLIDAAEEINVEFYDNYSKRIMGFWAERLPIVWLMRHNYRIKELPFFQPQI